MPSLKRSADTSSDIEEERSSKRSCSSTKRESRPINFLVLADTHELELADSGRFRSSTEYGTVDVVLHCGDLTNHGSLEGYQKALDLLAKIPAELKLVIAGNHEVSLDKDYFLKEGGQTETHERAMSLMTGSAARKAGVVFLSEGTHTFTLKNGTTFRVYASPYTPRDTTSATSAFQYLSSHDRFNPTSDASRPTWAKGTGTSDSIIPSDVDIVMTHGPPQYILDSTPDKRSAGCPHLRRALQRVKPSLYAFGHIHSGWGAQRVAYRSALTKSEIEELTLSDDTSEKSSERDDILPIRDFVSRGAARKKGFADLTGWRQKVRKGKETLCVNAAIDIDEERKPKEAPLLVAIDIPYRE